MNEARDQDDVKEEEDGAADGHRHDHDERDLTAAFEGLLQHVLFSRGQWRLTYFFLFFILFFVFCVVTFVAKNENLNKVK